MQVDIQPIRPSTPSSQPPGKGSEAIISNVAVDPLLDLAEKLDETSLEISKPFFFIDSESAVGKLIDLLFQQPTTPPSLYLDLEGVNLSRQGTVSILQILVYPLNHTYLVDIHTLGSKAFSTPGTSRNTLKRILESKTVPKVFFDVRNDSDALFSHFGICLGGVQDLQVMEFATRRVKGKFVAGLSKCIEYDLSMTAVKKKEWQDIKSRGKALFAPECGGSYDVFNDRPLSDDIGFYCVEDVKLMPQLWKIYSSKLTTWTRVNNATEERIRSSQSAAYNGHGRHKAIGPW